MTNHHNNQKPYNLETRTYEFAKEILRFTKQCPKNIQTIPLIDQVIRSGTSIGANYREANETETKKDFLFRIRICRKESKETIYWLELIKEVTQIGADALIQEAHELLKIFAAIVQKTKE